MEHGESTAMVRLKRISAQASEATIRHAQKILGTARRVISEDGKRMTITYRGEAEQGQVHNVAVYTKQEN